VPRKNTENIIRTAPRGVIRAGLWPSSR